MSDQKAEKKGKVQIVGGKKVKIADEEEVIKAAKSNIKNYQKVLDELKDR